MNEPLREILATRARAEPLYTRAQVDAALDRMAVEIDAAVAHSNPVLLAVLMGGMYPAVQLAMRLRFPCQFDYAHATRYRGALTGGALQWHAQPCQALSGRVVLVVDDILDQGHTLAQVVEECRRRGAARVLSAVLVRKQHTRPRVTTADFTGLDVDDRYVFGCGMDYKEYFRGLPEIYAVSAA